jgi:TIR domain
VNLRGSRPVQFYSCFISYSNKDQEFAKQIYADLQDKGVRCWFAEEDLKIGDKFQERIEESIRWHDKLLLVLSDNSIRSAWVEREVQAAFEREHESNRLVLFPIRLDEAVMDTTKSWAADIRRTRHIGEFGQWRERGSYKKALERLLRDLKAETVAPPTG